MATNSNSKSEAPAMNAEQVAELLASVAELTKQVETLTAAQANHETEKAAAVAEAIASIPVPQGATNSRPKSETKTQSGNLRRDY